MIQAGGMNGHQIASARCHGRLVLARYPRSIASIERDGGVMFGVAAWDAARRGRRRRALPFLRPVLQPERPCAWLGVKGALTPGCPAAR
jgi:hypothetical protein